MSTKLIKTSRERSLYEMLKFVEKKLGRNKAIVLGILRSKYGIRETIHNYTEDFEKFVLDLKLSEEEKKSLSDLILYYREEKLSSTELTDLINEYFS